MFSYSYYRIKSLYDKYFSIKETETTDSVLQNEYFPKKNNIIIVTK